jgi:hypothetical protein
MAINMYGAEDWEAYEQIKEQGDGDIISVSCDVRFNPDEDMDFIKCDAYVEE